VGSVLGASDSAAGQRNVGQLGMQFFADVSQLGIDAVARRAFGPRVAAVLTGPVAWVAGESLTPSVSHRDFSEIIRDSSGRTSAAEKREALYQLWQAYDRFGGSWHSGQKRELLECTDIVYQLR
jgi:hypothetical protein